MEIGAIETDDTQWTTEEEEWWPEEEDYTAEGEVNWIDDSYYWWYDNYDAVNSIDDDFGWYGDSWTIDAGEDAAWWGGEDTTWQQQPDTSAPQQAVAAVTTSTPLLFRPHAANSAVGTIPQQVGATTSTSTTDRTNESSAQPLPTSGQTSTRTVSWIQAVVPCAGLVVSPLICGVLPNYELRMILDSGATCHVCPLEFGQQFYFGNRQDTMDELPMLRTANGSPLYLHGARSVSLKLRNGATMNISFIVCDTQYPIVSVNRLREGGFNACLGKGNYLEKERTKERNNSGE